MFNENVAAWIRNALTATYSTMGWSLNVLCSLKVHKVFQYIKGPACENMASDRERVMEKTRKFQIVYAGLTNLCQHSTTDLTRGIMMNERKQSVLSKVRSFKHYKTTNSFFVFNLSPTSR